RERSDVCTEMSRISRACLCHVAAGEELEFRLYTELNPDDSLCTYTELWNSSS
ncbi:hypothetical protein M9458_041268, partial [Cirrhinus mrigala]